MSKKQMAVANFNVVWEKDGTEKPLLDYFDSIFMPALNSGIKKGESGNKYQIINVNVVDVGGEDYVLIGNLVKKTTLEILSDLDENGNLIELDDRYSAAPYSTFAIYLRNHRMVFVQNQKGSPNLRNFESTIRHILYYYCKIQNKILIEAGEEELPFPIIEVVGLPMRENIIKALRKVEKINLLTLRFYPLNGELSYPSLFEGMTTDLRRKVGSKKGDLILKSPTSIDGIAEVLEEARGTVDPIFQVTYPNKAKGTIKNDQISEKASFEVAGPNIDEETMDIAYKGTDLAAISEVSQTNAEIYDQNKGKVIPFIRG